MTLKFGSDPEFSAGYTKDGELYVLPPALLREDYHISFEQNGRHPIFKKYGDTFVHEDGCAFEMSTPPVYDWRDMWNTLHDTKEEFSKEVLSQFPSECNATLYSLPAMKYQVDRWLQRGKEFQLNTLFGCDPDEDVFNMRTKCKVLDASKHPWRYFGGHIHASGIPEIESAPLQAIKSMVLTAGLASTAYTDVPKLEKERLFLYGKPGKFRIQHYPNGETGVEYRTCSTRWTESIKLAEKVFTWAEIGLKNLLQGGLINELESLVMDDAKKAILSVDQDKAKSILAFISTKI